MQLDVKHLPKHCKHKNLPLDKKYYQYTIIDEASKERFIYFFDEYNQFNTTQFLMMAIKYYGYNPNIIQTDNGPEFTSRNWHKVKKDSLFTDICKLHNILHKTIRPRTPRHNGKIERSHRNDNNRFYQFLTFSSHRI